MDHIRNGIAICLLLVTLAGCKNEKQAEPAKQESAKQAAQVVVEMVVKNDDLFQLFYTEGTSDFGPNSIYVKVSGKAESQAIVFDLPGDAIVGNLRFDTGQNESQGEMIVNKMVVKIGDKELEISAADFFKYFTPSDYVKADPAKFSFTGLKVDGIYDPFFSGNNELVEVLKKIN
ncbi:hypothetical protein AAEO56_17235 [Flavobacterium sp. DGU11]|uniref:Uncharacterized protein n=1 Tax=Flavobacterium arundinis TaxID=3139143 RepID=A0ABU9I0S0_9FLAO